MRSFCFLTLSFFLVFHVYAEEREARILPLQEYIQLAIQNDTEFQTILIDELTLAYRKDLNLPARDLVLEAVAEYDLFLSQDREEPKASLALTRLFPMTGTEIEAGYTTTPGFSRTTNSSDFSVMITQPIAENAFGKATRLQDQIIGLEIDVIRHQIVEAYEDYMATVISAYFDWFEVYENLKIGESSYQQNLKLMENIKERQKSSIALPIDVNKITLQVLGKQETLIDLQEKYQNTLNFIQTSIRHNKDVELVPQFTQEYSNQEQDFERDFKRFKDKSRTYSILNLLEQKSTLEVNKNANELLPSIDLMLGYELSGTDLEIKDEDNLFFAGVAMEWPFGNQVDQAEYQTSKITQEKTVLQIQNTHYRLYTSIKNLIQQIERERQLLEIAQQKINLAQSILEDETENYSFGKVTINDYIQAVNTFDNNRFNQVRRQSLKAKLIVEFLRLTDQLIDRAYQIQ